jgi:hypothetical protein
MRGSGRKRAESSEESDEAREVPGSKDI